MKLHTLDTEGDITGTKAVMHRLMSNFVIADYSQTFVYIDEVSSLRYIYSAFDNDLNKLERDIKDALEKLYGRYFASVEIYVQVLEENSKLIIDLNLTVTQDGNVSKLSNVLDSKTLNDLYNVKGRR